MRFNGFNLGRVKATKTSSQHDPRLRAHQTQDDISNSNDQSWTRFPLAMPLAALLTLGLTATMAQLIATEFEPQAETETFTFDMNPVEKIADIKPVIDAPDRVETVETPPPPPVLDTDTVSKVTLPIIKMAGATPAFEPPKIPIGGVTISAPDTDAQPIVRILPIMLARFTQGSHSGYCVMRFDVSPAGQPFDVTATHCTNRQLERPSIKAVMQWKYNPKIRDGFVVAMSGVETKIRFDLADEKGQLLPLPAMD